MSSEFGDFEYVIGFLMTVLLIQLGFKFIPGIIKKGAFSRDEKHAKQGFNPKLKIFHTCDPNLSLFHNT